MKRRRLRWAASALDELKAAIAYIANDSPSAAARVASDLRRAGESLGQAATGRIGRLPHTYEKVLAPRPYLLIYRIQMGETGREEIIILHVVHGARRWPPSAGPA